MRIIVCNNYEEMSKEAAKIVAARILLKPDCVLGLATGSTPVGMYNELAKMNAEGEISFEKVKSFNLDEYYPIKKSNSQSYQYFMDENLFSKVDIKAENTHIPNGETEDPEAECRNYDALIDENGGVDLQILGIGQNGHIGFNEPEEKLYANTHLTGLTQSTIDANSRFFDSADDVPKQALTMGMASILKARTIVLLASGANKHEVISELMSEKITTSIPATLLNVHSDVIVICDKAAYFGE